MELICSLTSPYARRVRVLAHELGIEDQLKIQVVKPRESSDYLWTINPIGKVPTLRLNDGTGIFDSLIICDYLIATYPAEWVSHKKLTSAVQDPSVVVESDKHAGSQAKVVGTEPTTNKAADFQLSKVHRSPTTSRRLGCSK